MQTYEQIILDRAHSRYKGPQKSMPGRPEGLYGSQCIYSGDKMENSKK